jgi:hypothetical protein
LKTKLLRNQIIGLGWREEWRQIVQEAKAHAERKEEKIVCILIS